MDDLHRTRELVFAEIKRHCASKGYAEGPGINNFVPHDCVAAFAMAGLLIREGFDHFVAVAPEGHVYGYFLERLGAIVFSALVDYPLTRCEPVEDLAAIRGGRVLVIEDDVASGKTLELVVEHLKPYAPAELFLNLGHTRGVQRIENVPDAVEEVHLAEDLLDPDDRFRHEEEFMTFVATP